MIATTLAAVVTALWEDISMMITEWTKTIPEIDIAPHRLTMTTAPEANTIATALPINTLDASSLADPTPESANKDSENIIAGPDPDSEHAHDSNAIHELLMDISDSDEGQVDTWSGGIPSGIPQTRDEAPEADDHKESLHFFPYNHRLLSASLKIGTRFRRVLSRTTC
jgi:hypothetical protein